MNSASVSAVRIENYGSVIIYGKRNEHGTEMEKTVKSDCSALKYKILYRINNFCIQDMKYRKWYVVN